MTYVDFTVDDIWHKFNTVYSNTLDKHIRVIDTSRKSFKSCKTPSELNVINKKIKRIMQNNSHNSDDLENVKQLV